MSLTRDEVLKVAKLSMLEIKEEEVTKLQGELNEILAFVEELSGLNTDGVKPLEQVNPDENAFREDEVVESLDVKKALSNAPEKDGGIFIVPRTVGEN